MPLNKGHYKKSRDQIVNDKKLLQAQSHWDFTH